MNKINKFLSFFSKSWHFLSKEIWLVKAKNLPKIKAIPLTLLRIILLAGKRFHENRCTLRASALTFYSILSVVPICALAFGIAKGFHFEIKLQDYLINRFPGQEKAVQAIIEYAHNMLKNTKGGIIAGFGVLVLLWSVIKLLGNIEKSFNDIWGIKKGRPLLRKFSDYISLMFILPVFMITASSITVYVSAQLASLSDSSVVIQGFSEIFLFAFRKVAYIMVWIMFTFIYMFMPNTKVNFFSGLFAGIVAGTVYQLVQVGYVALQVNLSQINSIYGSFAALPLFLIWLQISWLVVFLGAELSFAHQNVESYEREPGCLQISPKLRKLISLAVIKLCVDQFTLDKTPLSDSEIAEKLNLPIILIRNIISELTDVKILSSVYSSNEKSPQYQPGFNIEHITISNVFDIIESQGNNDFEIEKTEKFRKLSSVLKKLREQIDNSPHNMKLKDV